GRRHVSATQVAHARPAVAGFHDPAGGRLACVSGVAQAGEYTLSQDAGNDVAFDIGQAEVAALEAVGELRVVEAQAVQQRGVEVVYVYAIADDVVAVVVRFAVGMPAANAAAGHPDAVAAAVMIAAVIVLGEGPLAVDRAAELAPPDHERLVQQA